MDDAIRVELERLNHSNFIFSCEHDPDSGSYRIYGLNTVTFDAFKITSIKIDEIISFLKETR